MVSKEDLVCAVCGDTIFPTTDDYIHFYHEEVNREDYIHFKCWHSYIR